VNLTISLQIRILSIKSFIGKHGIQDESKKDRDHSTMTILPENYFSKPNIIIKNNIDFAESLIRVILN